MTASRPGTPDPAQTSQHGDDRPGPEETSGAGRRPEEAGLAFVRTGSVLLLRPLLEPRDTAGRAASFVHRCPVRAGVYLDPDEGPVIIDTGSIGAGGARGRHAGGEALLEGLSRFAASPADVRHVVLTALTPGTLGALDLFPEARLHLSRAALDQVRRAPGPRDLAEALPRTRLPRDMDNRARVMEDARPVPALVSGGEGYDLLGTGRVVACPIGGSIAWPGLPEAMLVFLRTAAGPVAWAGQIAWSPRQRLSLRLRTPCDVLPGARAGGGGPGRAVSAAVDRAGDAMDRLRHGTMRVVTACDPASHPEDLFTAGTGY